MKLNNGIIGKKYTVSGMSLPLAAKRRLEVLGLTNGTVVEVMNNKSGGTMVIKIRGTRFALGKKMTEAIEVTD